jgi:hypothetical protein
MSDFHTGKVYMKTKKKGDVFALKWGCSGNSELIGDEALLTPFLGEEVQIYGEFKGIKNDCLHSIEVDHIALLNIEDPPPELNSGDFTYIEDILQPDGTVRRAIVGYTEGGYCSCTYYFDDLRKLLEEDDVRE